MDIFCYSGVPGSGKTLDSTYEAIKHYHSYNSPFLVILEDVLSKLPGKLGEKAKTKVDYRKSFPYGKINNVYSTYPVLLDKKRKIYSNKFSIMDFNNKYSFYPGACFIVDEVQLSIDSDDYDSKELKKFISYIAKFMQAARHFGCDKILINTQHPSRLFKKARNVCSGYVQHKKMFILPILKIGWIKTITYYELEAYGKFIPKDKQERKKLPFEYKKKTKFMNFNKVFKSYNSRYLAPYNYSKPLYNKGTYDSLECTYEDIERLFEPEKYENIKNDANKPRSGRDSVARATSYSAKVIKY